MCGIFGFIAAPGAKLGPNRMRSYLRDLFELSEPRGQEASGLAITLGRQVSVFKRGQRPRDMLRSRGYREFLSKTLADMLLDREARLKEPVAVIGHCRLVTNGAEIVAGNNHPIKVDGLVGIHNGIVTNDTKLWDKYPKFRREHESDSEILLRILDDQIAAKKNVKTALKHLFSEIQGSASIAFFPTSGSILGLATNLGSLHILSVPDKNVLVFASEAYFLQQFALRNKRDIGNGANGSRQLYAGEGCIIPFHNITPSFFSLDKQERDPKKTTFCSDGKAFSIVDCSSRIAEIKRCTKCILPSTYPFLEFDENGICNQCCS